MNWIPWNQDLVKVLFTFLRNETSKIDPDSQNSYKVFVKYLNDYYFKKGAIYHYDQWNHSHQLLNYFDADSSTNTSETLNRVLNKDAHDFKTQDLFLNTFTQKNQIGLPNT